jgi:hypothetical protein
VNSESYEQMVHKNIDRTNRKLEDLEKELQDKLHRIRLDSTNLVNDTLFRESIEKRVGLKETIHTIHYLKKHIGIWETYATLENFWNSRMVYPGKLELIIALTSWDSDILGPFTASGYRPSDVCVVMLSDKAVKWLNGIRILHKTVDPSFYSTASF